MVKQISDMNSDELYRELTTEDEVHWLDEIIKEQREIHAQTSLKNIEGTAQTQEIIEHEKQS